jgi:hypothetical protein
VPHIKPIKQNQWTAQAICGFTWPGIEFGEPPTYKYSFFEARPSLACLRLPHVHACAMGGAATQRHHNAGASSTNSM